MTFVVARRRAVGCRPGERPADRRRTHRRRRARRCAGPGTRRRSVAAPDEPAEEAEVAILTPEDSSAAQQAEQRPAHATVLKALSGKALPRRLTVSACFPSTSSPSAHLRAAADGASVQCSTMHAHQAAAEGRPHTMTPARRSRAQPADRSSFWTDAPTRSRRPSGCCSSPSRPCARRSTAPAASTPRRPPRTAWPGSRPTSRSLRQMLGWARRLEARAAPRRDRAAAARRRLRRIPGADRRRHPHEPGRDRAARRARRAARRDPPLRGRRSAT